MSRKSSDSSRCSCLSDDADVVDYSEAEQILLDVKTDLKSIQEQINTDLGKDCCLGHTARACKVSSLLVRLQSVDSRLHQIINLMQPEQATDADDLVSNFGMSVKLDMARNKLNSLKAKHENLRREWHSQEQHLNRIAEDVAKKENDLKYQSIFCTTQGYVLSKMLWKSSKCDCLLELMVSENKLVLELIKTLDGCLYAFSKTYQKEMPKPTAEEYQYVLCLCGVLSNLASIPYGRFFLISEPVCRDVYDQIIKILPKILVPNAEDLKWIMLVAIYNIMICKEGREYAKNNRYLLQSLSECISPPHSNKIIILALKIIGNLTNDPNKAYIAHVTSILPLYRLEELQQSKDSCTIRKQAKHILSSMDTEKLLHTIQLEQSKSRCNSACTQTFRKNPELFAYYVFTDTTNTGYTSSVSISSSYQTESEDRSGSVSAKSDFEVSESLQYPKFPQKPQTNSAPVSFYECGVMAPNVTSISAYNTRRGENISAAISPYVEDPSSCLPPFPTARICVEDLSSAMSPLFLKSIHRDSQEPMSGLSFTSNYSGREFDNNRTPVSTITPMSTYVDSMTLSALSSASKRAAPSSQQSPYSTRESANTSTPVSTVTPISTCVDSTMLPALPSSSTRGGNNQLSEPTSQCPCLPPYHTREFQDTSTPISAMVSDLSSGGNAGTANLLPESIPPYGYREFENASSPVSTYVDSTMIATALASSSKRLRSNFPINVKFTEQPSTLCHPSLWSMPAQPINTFQEPTPLRSEEMHNLQSRSSHTDINKLLTVTIGDHLQNPSVNRRNIGNNTFSDGQSNPSIVTVFRISKSTMHLTPDSSCIPFSNSISTNTSFPWGATVEDFFRIKNKNIGTTPQTSRRQIRTYSTETKGTEPFDVAYGGYEAYSEKLKKTPNMPKPPNVEKLQPQFDCEDVNMPSTSTGYYGYETLNPFVNYPDPNVSSSTGVVQKTEESELPGVSLMGMEQEEQGSCAQLNGTLGKLPEPKKSETSLRSQSCWECHAGRARGKKPKKKPFYRIYDFGHKKKS